MKTKRNLTRILAVFMSLLLLSQTAFAFEDVNSESEAYNTDMSDYFELETSGVERPWLSSELLDDDELESIIDDLYEDEADEVEGETDADPYDADLELKMGGHEKYIDGVGSGKFSPERTMTRGEFSAIVYRLMKNPKDGTSGQFKDVGTQWYAKYVNSLASAGLLNGYSDGKFWPNNEIKRAEVVAVFARFFPQGAATLPYTDVPSSHWAYKAIITAHSRGWIEGDGTGKFRPEDPIKRSEVVKIANIVLERELLSSYEQKFVDVPSSNWAFKHIHEAGEPKESVPVPTGDTYMVTGNSVRLRSQPNTTTSQVINNYNQGALMKLIDKDNAPWYKVTASSDNKTGYMHSDYLQEYDPNVPSGGTYSVAQYKTIYFYGNSGDSWVSDNTSVATVPTYKNGDGSTKNMYGRGFIYARGQGTANISRLNSSGAIVEKKTVKVTAPDAVRFTYAEPNMPTKGKEFYIYAITDPSKAAVKFDFSGAVTGSHVSTTFTSEERTNAGHDKTQVKVFRQKVTVSKSGEILVKAYSQDSSGNWSTTHSDFNMVVKETSSFSDTTTETRSVSGEMVDVIANWEGAYNLVYIDTLASSTPPTVGYGYVVKQNTTFYNSLTQGEMRAMLQDTLNNDGYVKAVNNAIKNNNLKMNQHQFDALVSFVYNCGTGTLTENNGFFRVLLNTTTKMSGSGKINTGDVTIYQAADPTSTKLGTIPNNTTLSLSNKKRVTAKDKADSLWYQVTYDGKTGWIRSGNVRIDTASRDLASVDEQVFCSHLLKWCSANSTQLLGLGLRRLAEAKVFCYGGYEDAYNKQSNRFNIGLDLPNVLVGVVSENKP